MTQPSRLVFLSHCKHDADAGVVVHAVVRSNVAHCGRREEALATLEMG